MSTIPVRDATRYDSQPPLGVCPVCTDTFPIDGRGIYCTPKCRQRAYRLRHSRSNRPTLTNLAAELRRQQQLIAQTVYECPSCEERFLGERRCGDCNQWCRKLGLGGQCSGCNELQALHNEVRAAAVAEERNRLAREIHDSLAHYLTVANVQLEAAEKLGVGRAAEGLEHVRRARRLTLDCLQDVRRFGRGPTCRHARGASARPRAAAARL